MNSWRLRVLWGKINHRMELEPATTPFEPTDDPRPRLLPPPPVNVVAIADVTLPAVAGLEKELNAFYVDLLKFETDEEETQQGQTIVYRAENVRLRLVIHEVPPPREDFRPLGVVVPLLSDLAIRLVEAKQEFIRRQGFFAGSDFLVLSDPAGNLVEVAEARQLI